VNTVPLYQSVHRELRRRILSGAYAPGVCLPAERMLIAEFGVSLITVRRALDELVLDGLIERRQGVGTFVRERARNVGVDMSRFTADVLNGRLRLVRTLLDDSLAPAEPDVAERLGVQAGSRVRHLMRLDCEGGIPFSVDELFIPPALGVCITASMAASPEFLHLWEVEAGIVLVRTEYEVSVQMPRDADQEQLQVGPDSPLLVTGELITGFDKQPLVWAVTRYRGDRTRLRGGFDMPRDTGNGAG
jgi:GntR family transcriptional regulator